MKNKKQQTVGVVLLLIGIIGYLGLFIDTEMDTGSIILYMLTCNIFIAAGIFLLIYTPKAKDRKAPESASHLAKEQSIQLNANKSPKRDIAQWIAGLIAIIIGIAGLFGLFYITKNQAIYIFICLSYIVIGILLMVFSKKRENNPTTTFTAPPAFRPENRPVMPPVEPQPMVTPEKEPVSAPVEFQPEPTPEPIPVPEPEKAPVTTFVAPHIPEPQPMVTPEKEPVSAPVELQPELIPEPIPAPEPEKTPVPILIEPQANISGIKTPCDREDGKNEQIKRTREEVLARKRAEFATRLEEIPRVDISLSNQKINRRLASDLPEINFSNITRKTPLEKLFPLVVIDVETTGLQARGNDIIEVSAIKYDVGFHPTSCFTTLLKPRYPIPAEASAINHITDDMVEDCPTFTAVAPAFSDYIAGCTIVGHNVLFDLKFLFVCGATLPEKVRYYDTLKLAKLVLTSANTKKYDHHTGRYDTVEYYDVYNYKLETLCDHYHIYRDNAHRSLSDCLATGMLFENLIEDKIRD